MPEQNPFYHIIMRSQLDKPNGVAGLNADGVLNVPSIVYQDNLGEIGYPPLINADGSIEAILSVRELDEDDPSDLVFLQNEIVISKSNDTPIGFRVGDGVTPNGLTLPLMSTMYRYKYSAESLPSSDLILEIPQSNLPQAPFLMRADFIILNLSDVNYRVRFQRLTAGETPVWTNSFQLVGFLTTNGEPPLYEYGKWPQVSQEHFSSIPVGRLVLLESGSLQAVENNRSVRIFIDPLTTPTSTSGQIEVIIDIIPLNKIETSFNGS